MFSFRETETINLMLGPDNDNDSQKHESTLLHTYVY